MTQAHSDVPSAAEASLRVGNLPFPTRAEPFPGWLALADPDGPIDLPRLFPDVDVRVEQSSTSFGDALAEVEPSLVVLIAPPAGPGDLQRVAGWLAAHRRSCAVLLSSHQAVAARLHALELGFNDAIDLSSDPMEVVGRLSIAGRRVPGAGLLLGHRILVGPGVELDLRARAIRRDGHLLSLRPKELALLEFLAMNPGRAFSREELLRNVWPGVAGNERMVDVYVFWLRTKIERDPAEPIHLLTVRGSGYLFDPPAASEDSPSNVNEPPTQR
ncbi:MAG: response regulator transcription factor [Candidatus Limnocylindrales bacterium]|jgi:DNA-binding response OmpR family regulator